MGLGGSKDLGYRGAIEIEGFLGAGSLSSLGGSLDTSGA